MLAALAAPGSAQTVRVGVLVWSMNIPGQVAMREGLEREADLINKQARAAQKPGVELVVRVAGDGPGGIDRQIAQMNELIGLRVRALIVQPTDNAALALPLREANRQKIPVVAYDQYINGGVLDAYLTSDNYQAGYLDGEYLAGRFDDGQEIRLVLVEYPRVSSTVERVNGFFDALKDRGQRYRILRSYEAVEPVAGKAAGQALLRDFPKKNSVDAVFTVNDGGGLAVVDELAAAGRTEIQVATIDGDPASVENIRRGRLTVIDSAQFCGPLGGESFKVCWSLLQGGKAPRQVLVPVFPITKETLTLYPGWSGPIPQPFSKPWPAKEKLWTGQLVYPGAP